MTTIKHRFTEAQKVILQIAQAVRSQANIKLKHRESKALLEYIRHLERALTIY